MGLVMHVCQLDFENRGANFWIQHYPLLPPKTIDNKDYIFTEFNETFSLFAHSVPQTTLRGCLGNDFDPNFICEGNSFRETNDSLESTCKQIMSPSLILRKTRTISILKYLEKYFENWIKLGPECLVYDKGPKNVEENDPLLSF